MPSRLFITGQLSVPASELQFSAMRAQGPGGQNVNKVASAVQLRFDVVNSEALSDAQKARILSRRDGRLTIGGTIVIKAQSHRSQSRNKADAQERLAEFLRAALHVSKRRKPTRPSLASKTRRRQSKTIRSQVKQSRRKGVNAFRDLGR